MSAYQMVHGCTRRGGHQNNNLNAEVMRVLVDENGIDVMDALGKDASETDIITAIKAKWM